MKNIKDICEVDRIMPIHQLNKMNEKGTKRQDFFPISIVQAIFDKTGIRLDSILSSFNYIFLPYKGDKETTRLQVVGLSRRKSLVISYRDLEDNVIIEMYNSNERGDNEWKKDDNWVDFNQYIIDKIREEFANNVTIIDNLNSNEVNSALSANQGRVLKEMINAIQSFNKEIVEELPHTGSNDTIYFVLNSDSTEDNNVYDEYVWIASKSKYEKLGSFTTNIDLSQYLLRSGGEINGTIYSGSKTGFVDDNEDDLLTAISKFLSSEEGYKTGNIATYFTDTFQIIPGEGIVILKVKDGYEAYLSIYIQDKIQIITITQSYSEDVRSVNGITIGNTGVKYGIANNVNNPNALFATDGSTTTLKTINGQSIFGEGNIEINSGDVFPEGGEEGQVLTKTSDGTAWQDPQAAFPEGGTTGQVLKKTAEGVEWGNDNDTIVTVNNTLTSDNTTEALSAAQGKALNEKIEALEIPEEYTLPIASSSQLGGVKIGEGITVQADGTISAADDVVTLTNLYAAKGDIAAMCVAGPYITNLYFINSPVTEGMFAGIDTGDYYHLSVKKSTGDNYYETTCSNVADTFSNMSAYFNITSGLIYLKNNVIYHATQGTDAGYFVSNERGDILTNVAARFETLAKARAFMREKMLALPNISIVKCTSEEYEGGTKDENEGGTKDENTLYIIHG